MPAARGREGVDLKALLIRALRAAQMEGVMRRCSVEAQTPPVPPALVRQVQSRRLGLEGAVTVVAPAAFSGAGDALH